LPLIPGANTGHQPQRPLDHLLRFAHSIVSVIDNECRSICRRHELRHEPAWIKQQRLKPCSLVRFGQMVWQVQVIVTLGRNVLIRRSNFIEGLKQELVLPYEALFSGLSAQKLADGVVQLQCATIHIESKQQREPVEFTQQVLGLDLVEVVSPQMLDDANRDLSIFCKNAEF